MATWQFRPLNPNDNSGVSTVDDNFANEERTSVEILVRETLQNPLDARHSDDLVEVHYNVVQVERAKSTFLSEIFTDDAIIHFEAGKLIASAELPETISFLVVEDFGTSGLEGTFNDSSVDGRTENWNAFWFREGEGAKPARSNGGAGQGKITLYAASEIRSLIALTRRRSDSSELLFGCCRFKQNYKLPMQSQRWAKEARWGAVSDPNIQALPIDNEILATAVKSELHLARNDRPGTSFLVPMPLGITLESIQKAVIDEFFVPIRRGRLKVVVGDKVLDKNTIALSAKSLGTKARYDPAYRSFLEHAIDGHLDVPPTATANSNWNSTNKLSDTSFDSETLAKLKAGFEKSELVSVDFPVKIRKKNSEPKVGRFRVVLRQELDADQSQELFVRQDLGIDGEKRLKGSRRIQPVFALTFIDDFDLSAFLTAAEEPTHRTWNSNRPKLTSQYDGTGQLLNSVRNAALRLVELLTPAGRRDNTALALYFADPKTIQQGVRRGPDGKTNPVPPVAPGKDEIKIPEAKPKPIQFTSLKDGFTVQSVPAEMAKKKLPLSVEIKTAYATTFGNPFKQWDAAEFWLNDESKFIITGTGISDISRDGNKVRFQMVDEKSNFTLTGFDSNRKVEVQINYREPEHADNLEND
jgi:hypothetical protein